MVNTIRQESGSYGLNAATGEYGDLIEAGVINCRKKTLHPGKVVVSFAMGSQRLFDYLNNNPMFEFHPVDYTNDPFVIAQNDKMVSINSALEVDVTGQANAEHDGRAWRGGLGGLGDFVRSARMAEGGRGIVALASTSRDGKRSRIVAGTSRGQVTLSRGDADMVITEWGVADLRYATFEERVHRMIAIADPRFREQSVSHPHRRRPESHQGNPEGSDEPRGEPRGGSGRT